MTRFLRSLILFAGCCTCQIAFAANAPATPNANAADRAWDAAKNFGRPANVRSAGKSDVASKRALQRTALIAEADQLRAFYTAHPTHSSAPEAKRLELLALTHAALQGDTANDARRATLLTDVRRNTSLALEKRFEAIAWNLQVDIRRRSLPTPAAYFGAQEAATRALITEFPAVSDGYESLLGIARDGPTERMMAIAKELQDMPTAPQAIKSQAQNLVARGGLIGTPLEALGMAASPVQPPAPTVVYTWTANATRDLAVVLNLAKQAKSARFFGICLDTDVTAAKTQATKSALPGEQHYDALGQAGVLAKRFFAGPNLTVYLADKGGVMRDVNGANGFRQKIGELSR